jgi:branched-chain amino acid transport system ATP-binding protein
LLSVEDVTRRFGGIVALDKVSLAADEGTITGLIGPNGAGKTTLFNVVTRLYKPDEGRVALDGQDLLRTPPYRIVRRGVARTFQNVVLFPTMTVTENVLVGAHTRMRPFGERRARGQALETLEYLGLTSLAARPAAGLPFGTLKRIELARALVSKPRLLLLDEPAAGLSAEEIRRLGALIKAISREGVAVLLVEHHADLIFDICDRVTVLNLGKVLAAGSPAEIREHREVVSAYLGA